MSCARPSGVSCCTGNPMRWRPWRSMSSTYALWSNAVPLRADPVGLPDRLQLCAVAEQEPHPAVAQAALEEELARALGRVVDRVDRDRERRRRLLEVVERPADLRRRQRTGVLARRVHERQHHDPAAEGAQRHGVAVLVAQVEVARRDVGPQRARERDQSPPPPPPRPSRVMPAAASITRLAVTKIARRIRAGIASQGRPSAAGAAPGRGRRRGSGLDEPAPDRVAHELDAVAHPELAQDVRAVGLDRLLGQVEQLGDLAVRCAPRR